MAENGGRLYLSIRVTWMIAYWIVFLSIPFIATRISEQQQFPLYHLTTMLKSVIIFMLALKFHQLIWFPENIPPNSAQRTDAEPTTTRLYRWVNRVGHVLYYAFPISKSRSVPTWSKWILMNLEFLWWIIIKMIAHTVVVQWMKQILEQESDSSSSLTLSLSAPLFFDSTYAKLLFLFSIMVLSGSWNNDLLCCVVHIVTLGYYQVLAFLNYPFLSTSLKDFWGCNYNLVTHTLLKECVYIPAQNYGGYSKRTARYLTFAVSGLLHVYVVFFTFGRGYVRTMAFFLLQPIWIDVEKHLVIPVGRTHMFFWLTLFLYLGLFVEVLPEYLEFSVTESIHPWIDQIGNQTFHWLNDFCNRIQ